MKERGATAVSPGPVQAPVLPEAERLARLRLARTRGIGPLAAGELLARFGNARAALDALP
ncbi:MAG: DNA-protecting protein DprA, partial [Alphaproteobacteria bacterium]